MLQGTTGKADITRIGPNHETIIIASGANANLQGAKNGAQVSPPWANLGADSDIGFAMFAEWSMLLDGDDGLPGYEPRPGDRITYTSNNGASSRNGVYRIVASPTSEEGYGLDYRDLPVCKLRSGS
jgi:hypothetical protein